MALAALISLSSCEMDKGEKAQYAYMNMADEYGSAANTARRVANSHFDPRQEQNLVHDSLMRVADRYDSMQQVYVLKVDSVRLQEAEERLRRIEGKTKQFVESRQ